MNDIKPICINCGGEMRVKEKLKNGRSRYTEYRRRRFACPDCGYTELIFSGGTKDIKQYGKDQFIL